MSWSRRVTVIPEKNVSSLRRSLSTATHFSLQMVNIESASKVIPNDCNDMFWCMSITNNVKSCKKFDEKAQTGKFTVNMFLLCEICSVVLKTWKTRETKITQNFQIIYPTEGGTI